MGQQCSAGGYRWGRMLDQKCNVTLCQQVLDVVGDNITLSGKSELWCGNKPIDVTSRNNNNNTATPTPTPETTAEESSKILGLDQMIFFIIVGVAAVVLFILVPMTYLNIRNAARRRTAAQLPLTLDTNSTL